MSSDGRNCITVKQLADKFDAMVYMSGKPKILIIDAGRGHLVNSGYINEVFF